MQGMSRNAPRAAGAIMRIQVLLFDNRKGKKMENCWEILGCGREAGGAKVAELGECITSREGMGHSCWAIAGTLCGGAVQGSVKDKKGNCLVCGVHNAYNRVTGTMGQDVAAQYPDEDRRYREVLRSR